MAIDFPSNPTNGQVYSNWIYDSSITAWRNVNTDTGIGTLNAMGLKNVVPTSVVVDSGSATVNANGFIEFSGATALKLNGVFSATYNSYKIIFSQQSASATNDLYVRLRASGTDLSASYYANGTLATASTISGVDLVNISQWTVNALHSGTGISHASTTMEVIQPFLPKPTTFQSKGGSWTSTQNKTFNLAGFNSNTSAYDGITFFPSGAGTTMGGNIQVFGYTD